MLLYKYRSLDNFKHILDILVKGRLYGTSFENLNDPMEGAYRYNSKVTLQEKECLLRNKKNTLICSLSTDNNIGLMWTHYANNGKGCCIEVEVTSKNWEKFSINYSNELPNNSEDIKHILGTKASCWQYEKEVWYIRTVANIKGANHYLEVKVTKVIFGYAVSTADFNMYKQLIEGINKIKKKKSYHISCEKISHKNDVRWI